MIFILAMFRLFICLIFILLCCLLFGFLLVVATALFFSVPNPSLESLSLSEESSLFEVGFALSPTVKGLDSSLSFVLAV